MFISHDLSVVRYMADRIGVMYLGKLVEIGTGDDIYARAGPPVHRRAARARSRCPSPAVQRGRTSIPMIRGAAVAAPPSVGVPVPDPVPPGPSPLRRGRAGPRSFGGEHYAACHFPLQEPVKVPAAVTPAA